MKHITLFSFFCLPFFCLFSQNSNSLDSLMAELRKVPTDTGKVLLYYRISHELQVMDINKSSEWAEKAISEAKRLKFKKGIAYSFIQLGNIELIKSNYQGAEDNNREALKLFEASGDKVGKAIGYNNLGIIYHSRNEYSKGLEFYRKSLGLNRECGRNSGEANSLFCIGTLFENMSQLDSALVYYYAGQQISERIGDTKLMAYAKVSIGNVYFLMQDYLKAYDYNFEASELYKKAGNKQGMLKTYRTLGLLAEISDSINMAVAFYVKSLNISREIMSSNDISNSMVSLANLYEQQGITDTAYSYYLEAYSNYSTEGNKENAAYALTAMARIEYRKQNFVKSEKLLNEARIIAESIESPGLLQDVYFDLAFTLSGKNDFRNAFSYLQKHALLKDSVMSIEKQNQILDLQTRYETEKKEKENQILKQEQKILQLARNFLIAGAVLLMITVFFILRTLRIKKKDNTLLRKQKKEIEHQKEIVEEQKKEITDSIRYALRIQSAILPSEEIVRDIGTDLFILYLPRDIVSGDFYLLCKLNEDNIIVCAADCTGHGVPGAFMSMLGMSLLSDIINNNRELFISQEFSPADILNTLRERVKSALSQTGKEGEAKDGMDMSVCVINTRSLEMQYAGANNSVYIVSEGNLDEIKALRNPIGIYIEEKEFVNNKRQLVSGSVVYLFSDGFSDQINPGGSKFLSKNLKKLLSEIGHLPIKEQESILLKRHLDFRGNEGQVDDILLIGVKIN